MDELEIFELIRFCKNYPGVLKHTTPEFILKQFKASKISLSEGERQPVRQNEDAKEICDCSQSKGCDLDEDGYPYCIECQKNIRAN